MAAANRTRLLAEEDFFNFHGISAGRALRFSTILDPRGVGVCLAPVVHVSCESPNGDVCLLNTSYWLFTKILQIAERR